jgi:hypothetical protein
MKTPRLIAVLALILLAAAPLFAKNRQPQPPASYCVTAARQVHELARKSLHAWRGLSRAAFHSPAIAPAQPPKTDPDQVGPTGK